MHGAKRGNMQKILIIDDEADILEFVSYNLEKAGFEVFTAPDGDQGIQVAKAEEPDLILLDVMMPGMDGMEVCSTLRGLPEFDHTLIVFLTARGENYSQIAGFEAGGDDYISKPITPKLLVARVKALLKRSPAGNGKSDVIMAGPLRIDKDKMLVYKDDHVIPMPKMEFNLLNLLASKPGKVFSREQIYRKLWGQDILVSDRTMDVHIRKLREKIGEDCIKTVIGVGYKYNEECG